MATYWSVEEYKIRHPSASTHAAEILSLDELQPSASSSATTPYVLDYSLMTVVLAILTFLWMQ